MQRIPKIEPKVPKAELPQAQTASNLCAQIPRRKFESDRTPWTPIRNALANWKNAMISIQQRRCRLLNVLIETQGGKVRRWRLYLVIFKAAWFWRIEAFRKTTRGLAPPTAGSRGRKDIPTLGIVCDKFQKKEIKGAMWWKRSLCQWSLYVIVHSDVFSKKITVFVILCFLHSGCDFEFTLFIKD